MATARNIFIDGRRTSIRLEPALWTALHRVADRHRISIHDFCSAVAAGKGAHQTLTSAVRARIVEELQHGLGLADDTPREEFWRTGIDSRPLASRPGSSD